jgi:ATP-dependent helicase/nuclease subunit B
VERNFGPDATHYGMNERVAAAPPTDASMAAKTTPIYSSLLPLLEQAGAGTSVVTANQRAGRFLRHQYMALMQQRGLAGWTSPSILPSEAWLESLWQQHLLNSDEDRLLLTASQEFQVWESIVHLPAPQGSQSALSIAQLAQKAWRLSEDYSVDRASWKAASRTRDDWQTMHRWGAEFEKRCEKRRWISHAALPRELMLAAGKGTLKAGGPLRMVGFDRVTPAQNRLLALLDRNAQHDTFYPISEPAGPPNSYQSSSAEDEMEAAAIWAQQKLNEGDRRLAIISPSVGRVRGDLERTLTRVIGRDQFGFSLGLPTAQYSLVKCGLLLLQWTITALSLDEVSWLLLSPDFGGDVGPVEISARARYDAHVLRRVDTAQPQLSLEQFAKRLGGRITKAPEEWSTLRETLRCSYQALRYAEDAGLQRRQLNAFEWAEFFQRALTHFGFPGKCSKDSVEFQTLQRWKLLLDQFAGLAFDGSRLTATQAMQALRRLAADSIFQPELEEAPLQVLGPLEAAGSLFDGLWFLGASEVAWPISGRANPLLPWKIQRDAKMPHSSPEVDYDSAAGMTSRLANSSPTSVFSWARKYAADSARPSPLVQNFLPLAIDESRRLSGVKYIRHQEPQLFPDRLPLLWEKSRGTLSASSLRAQAACPFQAFATVRLQARPLESQDDGLDPRQRGKFLHVLMQSIWTSTQDPQGLRNLSTLNARIEDGTLQEFVSRHAEATIETRSSDRWEQQFFASERQRLTALVEDWLQRVETNRPNFEVSDAEKKFEGLEIGDATFTLKIDRIDKLLNEADSGEPADSVPPELILLDYKTGDASVKDWDGERPADPQLPLYATYALAGQPIAAVAFAQIRADKARFCGKSQRNNLLPRVSPNSPALALELPLWREAILNLTAQFVAGRSIVDPKDGIATCRNCHCAPLCRIALKRRANPDSTDEESEDAVE